MGLENGGDRLNAIGHRETGREKTGQNMTHYINPEGLFIKTFNRLTTETLEALRLKYLPAYTPHDKI
jgi:hypothetical protein